MKKTICIAVLATMAAWAQDGALPQDKMERHRKLVERRTGGYITQRMPGSGKFVFVNAQTRVDARAYGGQIPVIEDVFAVECVAVAYSGGDVTLANAAEVLKELGGAAGVFLVDQPGLPALYVVPERGWAFVNVAALAEDGADAEKIARRVRREVWRGFAMAAGSPNTEWDRCLLNSITSLKQLDSIDSEAVSPEPMTKIARHLTRLGILPFKRIPYRQACVEGWAPAPTNDAQRAIWDKVQAEKERGPAVQRPIRRQGAPRAPRRAK